MTLALSILDQSTVASGRGPAEAIRETLALARLADGWGYRRYWLAEHHNSASHAGTAPEILVSAIAATTRRIRVGTAGGLNAKVKVRDLIIAQGATTDSAIVRDAFTPFNIAQIADICLMRDSVERAERAGMRYHVGNMLSSDIFYHIEPGLAGYGRLPAHGILGVEMEAAALYTLAARFDRKALAICTMTDCLITHAELSSDERQSSLREMITLSLDVAVGD
jgi:DeoD family purine-nucleoside phosphorylase